MRNKPQKFTHTYTIEIPFGESLLIVDVTASLAVENDGIGSYEFWGFSGYDSGTNYLTVEDATWNKDLYTAEENAFIDKYIDDNIDKIDEDIVNDFEATEEWDNYHD
jgi:hypothetical protein